MFFWKKEKKVEQKVIRGIPSSKYEHVAWFPEGYTRLNGNRIEVAGWYWLARDGDASSCPAFPTDCDAYYRMIEYIISI